jgi:hypothetical protein
MNLYYAPHFIIIKKQQQNLKSSNKIQKINSSNLLGFKNNP